MLYGRFPFRSEDENMLLKMIRKGPTLDNEVGESISTETK